MGVSAYFADQSDPAVSDKGRQGSGELKLADVYLTVEPYALALPRGDEDFRLEVCRSGALGRIHRSA